MIKAMAAKAQGQPMEMFEYDPGQLGEHHVEIDVVNCGICHSDLSMLNNDWGMTEYPFVPGHEVIGRVAAMGAKVKGIKEGQLVGLGWFSESCLHCSQCMSGDHNLCQTAEATIIGRHGGFATKVRADASWVFPISDEIDEKAAGPLFCGGITVFNPIVQHAISPTSRVAVVGIGGLGHLALQFLHAWGCHVTAFSTSPDKEKEAKELGAHAFLNSRDEKALESAANSFDLILVTVNANLNWDAFINCLKPKGKLHLVGAAAEVKLTPFPMILGQKSFSASPLGSPETINKMLEFCARHKIAPMIETFPMSKANEAMEHLEKGSPRYRIVLQNDLK